MNSKQSVLTAIVLISLLSPFATRAAGPQQTGTGSVEGSVVRLRTSDPIAGVNVEMRRVEGTPAFPLLPPVFLDGTFSPGAIVLPNSPNPADAFYAATSTDGAFRFTNLKPGKYRLLAAHPEGTYYPAEYGQRNPRGPGYDFSFDSASSMKVRLEMAPMASVSGHVTGADGKPATHVHVLAAEITYQNGTRVLNQMQGVETDDRGNYRLFWLPPGKYYIGAFPEGIRRRQTAVPFGPPGAVDSLNQFFTQAFIHYRSGSDGEVLRDVYDIVYSPGVTNPDAAGIVDLRQGSNVAGIDIALAPGRMRAVRIRGTVIDGASGRPAGNNASVRATPRIDGPVSFAPTTTTTANGTFEIDGLGQGEYVISATLGQRNSQSTAIQILNVDTTDIDGLRLSVTPGSNLSGRITLDGVDATGYQVGLEAENRPSGSVYSTSSSSGLISIARVHAGTYRITVGPNRGEANPSVFVKSIRFAGTETASGIVQIGDSPSGALEITLSSKGGIVEGQVNNGQRQPAPNVMVGLVPADSRRPDLFKTATADLGGHYRISGIAPGNYLLFAWPWLPNGLWQNQEFLRAVEGRGTRLVISEGSSTNMELPLLPEVNF